MITRCPATAALDRQLHGGARSALGEKFVDLDPGDPSAGLLSPDHVISAVHSVGAQDLSDEGNPQDARGRHEARRLIGQIVTGKNRRPFRQILNDPLLQFFQPFVFARRNRKGDVNSWCGKSDSGSCGRWYR